MRSKSPEAAERERVERQRAKFGTDADGQMVTGVKLGKCQRSLAPSALKVSRSEIRSEEGRTV